ncbi:GNAT family N-acetyltransferase [Streptomyces sp. NBC_00448]|uniref:GNAT family N-acetyltransferase n=1 Tax=Streptomyces sp. NBC_00448 TaxID=2903652 RepID=UPI002E1A3662
MGPDEWHLTDDIDELLRHAGDFLRSRPALHTIPLTVMETLRTRGAAAFGGVAPVFGRLERAGEVRAVLHLLRRLNLTPLTPEQADALAAHLAGTGRLLTGVSADHDTATAFAEAWQRHTDATPTPLSRLHLYRLASLTPPHPLPTGRAREAGDQDHEHIVRWCGEFVDAVGEATTVDAAGWAATRFAGKQYTFWETPDGAPVAMAGRTPLIAGQIRVDPVYTPLRLRGHGYAAAVTLAAGRAALSAGATDVVLFADAANPTSNRLYRRIGFRPLADFTTYDFA